ncbi:MAG: hypothetical protein Q4G07_05895 [Oscillospiraceae bacterium]|nr:hypothetical protein [Oscillospiraceae bacterium]
MRTEEDAGVLDAKYATYDTARGRKLNGRLRPKACFSSGRYFETVPAQKRLWAFRR